MERKDHDTMNARRSSLGIEVLELAWLACSMIIGAEFSSSETPSHVELSDSSSGEFRLGPEAFLGATFKSSLRGAYFASK